MMAKQIPLETEEELQFVKDFILLPIILDVLERDIQLLQTVPLKMPTVYIQVLRGLQDQVTADLVKLRRQLREHGMKVYDQHRTKISADAEYLCRGYHYKFSMLWGVVRSEVEERLRSYLHIEFIKDQDQAHARKK
jgi:hypothetical protein